MDFMELCKTRQACRDFDDRPVEHEKLVKCIEAARLCPSGCNSQPWRFIVVEKPELVAEVAKCSMQLGINEYFAKARAFVVVLEEHAVLMPKIRPLFDSQIFARQDAGGAIVTICLAAAEQGLGSCVIGLFDREKLCQLLDLPADQRFASMIALGYPSSDKIREKTRKPMEEIARFV